MCKLDLCPTWVPGLSECQWRKPVPPQGRPCHLHLSPPQEPCSLLPVSNPRKPALTFGQLREIRWIAPSMSLTCTQVYILKCLNYLPEWQISSYLWQMDLEHELTQLYMALCWGGAPKAPSTLRFSRECPGCSQVDPKRVMDPWDRTFKYYHLGDHTTEHCREPEFSRDKGSCSRNVGSCLLQVQTNSNPRCNPQIQPKPD